METDTIQGYKKELEILIIKSQEIFERQLNYISAGAIGISFAFIEKLIGSLRDASFKGIIFIGWFVLTMSLLINLISHFKAKSLHSKTISEIINDQYDQRKALDRNNTLDKYNYWSISLTIFGIILILIFVTVNVI